MRIRSVTWAGLLLLAACTGKIGEAPGLSTGPIEPPPTGPPAPERPDVCGPVGTQAGYVPVMRITDAQYDAIIGDLFSDVVRASPQFPAAKASEGYTTSPDANVVSLVDAESIMLAAEDAALQIAARLPEVLPCAADADRACAEVFVDTYVSRAFRRAVEADERALLLELFDEVAATLVFEEAIAVVASAVLQMPQFLYVLERGVEVPGLDGVVALDDHELATRLALTFWGTLPDETLRGLADEGRLRDAAMLETQARRLLESDRALDVMKGFHQEWMRVEPVKVGDKDVSRFSELDAELARSISGEFDRFITAVLRDEGSSLSAMLTSNRTFVNRTMADFYGLDPSVSAGPDDWVAVELDAAQRSGVMSRPAVMATHAHQLQTSPVFRGKLVRTRLLCDNLPPPPPDAMSMTPEFPPNATQREKSEIFLREPSCGGCHALMNPIGLGFENFDALGRWQTQEEDGRDIDVSGNVVNGRGLTEFVGATDLAHRLADFDVVHRCMVQQWFRYSFGRDDQRSDGCSIDQATRRFVEQNLSITEMLVGLTLTDAFRFRRVPGEDGGVP